MTPLLLATALSVILAVAVLFRHISAEAHATGLLTAILITSALGVFYTAPAGELGFTSPVMATGVYADGSSVETILELPAANGGRSVRGLTLRTAIPWLRQGLVLLFVLSVLGLLLGLRIQDPEPLRKSRRLWLLVCSVLGGICALISLSMPTPVSDPATIKSFLSTFAGADEIRSFSVPTETWTYVLDGLNAGIALGVLAVLGGLWFAFAERSNSDGLPRLIQGACAVGLVGTVLWQGLIVGGFPWRDDDSALAIAAMVGLLSFWFARSPRTSSCLAMLCSLPLLLAL